MTGLHTTAMIRSAARALAAGAILVFGTAQGQSITKCQDSEGNWHYGDFAAEACAQDSTITEIDERGVKIDETDAPPTREELDARKAEKEALEEEKERQVRQEREDKRLLQTYDSVDAIIRARDERIQALERDLESHRMFREDLVEEKQQANGDDEKLGALEQQIQQYDLAIQNLEAQRQSIIQQYNEDLERYRGLTGE